MRKLAALLVTIFLAACAKQYPQTPEVTVEKKKNSECNVTIEYHNKMEIF